MNIIEARAAQARAAARDSRTATRSPFTTTHQGTATPVSVSISASDATIQIAEMQARYDSRH